MGGVDFPRWTCCPIRRCVKESKSFRTGRRFRSSFTKGSLDWRCDIVRQLEESGELLPSLGIDPSKGRAYAAEHLDFARSGSRDQRRYPGSRPGQQLRMVLQRGGQSIDLYFDSPRANEIDRRAAWHHGAV